MNTAFSSNCDCIGEVIVLGCTDQAACNFNMDANSDDGSCLWVGDTCDDGDSNTMNDSINVNCECQGETISEVEDGVIATIKIFPIPANHQLTIQWKSAPAESIQVFDMQGARVTLIAPSAAQVINTSNWSNGLYLLLSSNGTLRSKIEIRH